MSIVYSSTYKYVMLCYVNQLVCNTISFASMFDCYSLTVLLRERTQKQTHR